MIIITGAARSGTTVTTEIFKSCGANFGSDKNRLNEDVTTKRICKERLRGLDSDPLGQSPLPSYPITPKAFLWPSQSLPDVIKEAKITILWEDWHLSFPEAKWVIVRRDKETLLDSLQRTSFMKAYKTRLEWEPWVDYHLERIEEMKSQVDYREVWPKNIRNDTTEIEEVIEWCGFKWNPKSVDKIKNGLLK